jgi:hypothetical protein
MSESAQITAVLIGLAALGVVVTAGRTVGRSRPGTEPYAGFRTDARTGQLLLLACEGHCDGDVAHETDGDGTATCVLCGTTRPVPAPDPA